MTAGANARGRRALRRAFDARRRASGVAGKRAVEAKAKVEDGKRVAHVMAVSKVTSTTCAPRSFTSNWPREKGPAFVGGAKEIVMQRGRLGGIPLPRPYPSSPRGAIPARRS